MSCKKYIKKVETGRLILYRIATKSNHKLHLTDWLTDSLWNLPGVSECAELWILFHGDSSAPVEAVRRDAGLGAAVAVVGAV